MNASSGDRVLVVEEPDGRDMLQLGLEMAGYEVDVADDGEAGLIVAAARTPAAAIIAIHSWWTRREKLATARHRMLLERFERLERAMKDRDDK
jgi:CheY-like chemotaxis protein